MKKLYLLFLLSGISIHAMDNNLKIVPFEHAKHYNATRDLLSKTVNADLIIRDAEIVKRVLVGSQQPDNVLGVIAYMPLLPTPVTWIQALAIASEHEYEKYGTMLVKYVESLSPHNHILRLYCTYERISFFNKLGYRGGSCKEKIIQKNSENHQ